MKPAEPKAPVPGKVNETRSLTTLKDLLPGAKVRAGHRKSLFGILGAKNMVPIRSEGKRFFMVGHFPHRHLISLISEWADKNRDRRPTYNDFEAWAHKINGAPRLPPRITIAQTGEEISRRTYMALIGGASHEGFHRLYSGQGIVSVDDLFDAVYPYWVDGLPYHRPSIRKLLQEGQNYFEDIRIERIGCADFPGVYVKMADLTDFILDQEAKVRQNDLLDPGSISPARIAYATLREVGLGYSTLKTRAALAHYKKVCPQVVEMVRTGPLAPLLVDAIPDVSTPEALAFAKTQFSLSTSLSFRMIGILHELSLVKEPPRPPPPPPPQKDPREEPEDSEDSESEAGEAPEPESGDESEPEAPESESGDESEPEDAPESGDESEEPGEESKEPSETSDPSEPEESEDELKPEGDEAPAEDLEPESGNKPEDESESSSDSEDETEDEEGEDSDNSDGEGDSEDDSEGEEGEDGPGAEMHQIAEDILDGDLEGLKDYASALEEAIEELVLEAIEKTPEERPYNPFCTENDKVSIVGGDRIEGRKALDSIMRETRRETTYLRTRLRSLFRALELGDRIHGVRRGRVLSERHLVDTFASLRGGREPSRAFTEETETIDVSISAHIVLDESQSMGGAKVWTSRILATLGDALDSINARFAISGFRDASHDHYIGKEDLNFDFDLYHRSPNHSIVHDMFKGFEERWKDVAWRVTNLLAVGGTPMADGIELALRSLSDRKEGHRILFIVTDGQPNDTHSPVILSQIRRAKEAGIHLIGLGLGREAKYVTTLFPDHVWADKLSDLPPLLVQKLHEVVVEIGTSKRGKYVKE